MHAQLRNNGLSLKLDSVRFIGHYQADAKLIKNSYCRNDNKSSDFETAFKTSTGLNTHAMITQLPSHFWLPVYAVFHKFHGANNRIFFIINIFPYQAYIFCMVFSWQPEIKRWPWREICFYCNIRWKGTMRSGNCSVVDKDLPANTLPTPGINRPEVTFTQGVWQNPSKRWNECATGWPRWSVLFIAPYGNHILNRHIKGIGRNVQQMKQIKICLILRFCPDNGCVIVLIYIFPIIAGIDRKIFQ